MDSNHRYPAPKAGAIAARRHPVQCAIIWIMDKPVNAIIVEKLRNFYPERIRFIKEEDPYRFLITVMLSASTTDRQAENAASSLFSVYPDAKSVGEAEVSSIESLIRSAGLSKTKAPRIKDVSRYIASHGIPDNIEKLQALPGIGEKTAACYALDILGQDAVIADTHFVRTSKRLGFIDTSDRIKAAREIRERFPENEWGFLSMAVNKLGRDFCHPRPDCKQCFLSSICPSSEVLSGES